MLKKIYWWLKNQLPSQRAIRRAIRKAEELQRKRETRRRRPRWPMAREIGHRRYLHKKRHLSKN